MVQFVAFDSHVEVSGAAILSYVAALGETILPVLAKYGITHPHANGWYPQQAWLDAFRDIAYGDFNTTLDLVAIGMKIPESAVWPPAVQTLEDALFSIDVAYHINHRHGKIGCYRAMAVDDRHIEMFCENPYPCDFDFGIIYGTAKLYAISQGYSVEHDNTAPCRKKGGEYCIYHVQW